MTRRLVVGTLAAGLVLGAAGCGGDDGDEVSTTGATEPATSIPVTTGADTEPVTVAAVADLPDGIEVTVRAFVFQPDGA